MHNLNLRLSLITTLLSIALSGCMVGPNFHSPAAPETKAYTASPQPKKTLSTPSVGSAGKSQYFADGQDIPAAWWTLFHSPALNDLIQTGLANSPTLAAAEATLRQTKETVNAQVGLALYPSVNASLSGERQRFSDATFGVNHSSLFNLYNASVSVTYTLDFFGGARRGIEALQAQVDYQRFQVEAAYLTLTSNIVTTAITVASLEEQLKATHELIQAQADQLVIAKKQFHLGGISGGDVYAQESQLAQTQASLPPLEQSLAQSRHALAVLIGAFPSDAHIPDFKLNSLQLPTTLPVSLPSALAHQRPDIRASEALLHAANAQIGVATANLFPQITLNGGYGWEAASPNNLFKNHAAVWSYGSTLLQPIFQGGALRAQKRAAIDAHDAAAAQYRQTVLQAFQNVADTLRALQHDAELLHSQTNAEISARKSLDLTQKQYRLGGVSYLSLLTANKQYQQAKIGKIQAQAARYTDTAALYQALGGGWWNRQTEIKKM